ncbi:MAG: Ig-like domain-containing protein [Caldimonas sp.]
MKTLKWALAAMTLSLVAACGGSGNAGTSPFGGGGCSGAAASGPGCSSSASSVDVLASTVQVGSGGGTVTVSAVVKDSNNVALAGAPVSFSATSGNITAASAVTNSSGVATATFTAGADRSNRQATVSVKSGSATGRVTLDIVGTVLSYSGVTTVPLNGVASLPIKAVDSSGTPISGIPVTVTSSLGNGLSSATLVTDSLGTAAVTYTATNAGADTLAFNASGSAVAPVVQVSAANFTFVTPAANTQIPVTTSRAVTVQYLSANVPQVGKTVNFAATAGVVTPISAVTNGAGQVTVSISSLTASPAVIQASVPADLVQTTLPVVFVAQTPARLVLQVSPTAIGPNPAGSNSQQAQLVASVTDANGNPVTGATVTFNRVADPSGGNLSQASTATDASGQATVQYIAGASTTANNGVQIRATVLGAPAVFGDASVTVNQSALFIALGTGNTISNLDPQTYKKDWVVYVTDSNGVAVPNINLTIKVLPIDYRKGTLVFGGGSWGYNFGSPGQFFLCPNEDANYNGILDPGEDFNQNNSLQPGNVISLTTAQTSTAAATGIARTGTDGRATITLLYAESYVPWVKVRLIAQAIVSGTESSTEAQFIVDGLATDFTSAAIPPAGVVSPFGVNDCATAN